MSRGRITTCVAFQNARIAVLSLTVALVGAPAFAAQPIDRAALTKGLVPVTGEKTRSLDLTVPFARDSAELTEAARRQLGELAAALSGERLKKYLVEIYGHTDASGPAKYNLKLSRARAAETVRYLVEQHGLDRKRFRHEGYGEERLLTGLAPDSPRQRRVEVVVIHHVTDNTEAAGARAKGEGGVTGGDGKNEQTPGERGGLRAVQ